MPGNGWPVTGAANTGHGSRDAQGGRRAARWRRKAVRSGSQRRRRSSALPLRLSVPPSSMETAGASTFSWKRGHAAENLMLQAVALGLATTMVGAFVDDEVKRLLHFAADETPLCLIPVGIP